MVDGLQRYQIMESLGQGGQGHTYRAIDRETGDRVAVKVLSLPGQENWKAFDLFEREVATLESLEHPGIPRFRGRYASEETGDYFLVMDLVSGQPLSRIIRKGKSLSLQQIRSILDQALDILEYLHGRVPPVIHRDIKPSNLLLGEDGRLSLVDFGGVRVAIRPEGGSTMIGTFGYMAPEQLHGDAGPATDIYALGATVAALAAGREADGLARDGLTIQVEDLFPSGPLRSVLEAMLRPDPRERLPDAAAVRRALSGAGVQSVPKSSPGASEVAAGSDQMLSADTMRELSEMPAPINAVVWLLSAIATGFLVAAEVILLPLVFAIMRVFGVMKHHPELRSQLRDVRRSIVGGRRQMKALAAHTDPTREDWAREDRAREDRAREDRVRENRGAPGRRGRRRRE